MLYFFIVCVVYPILAVKAVMTSLIFKFLEGEGGGGEVGASQPPFTSV